MISQYSSPHIHRKLVLISPDKCCMWVVYRPMMIIVSVESAPSGEALLVAREDQTGEVVVYFMFLQ